MSSIRARTKHWALAAVLGAFGGLQLAQAGEILRYVDAQGRIVFYYRPDSALSPRSGGDSRTGVQREAELLPMIERISLEHNVDPRLVRAVMRVESNFRSTAVSPKGATGLMQLMPATAAHYGVMDMYDVEQNIRGGVRFLRHLQSRYGENLELLLAAYNAGETAVERAGGAVPAFRETQQYVVDVLHHFRNRGGVFDGANADSEADSAEVDVAANVPAVKPIPVAAKAAAKPAVKPAVARRKAEPAPSQPIRVRTDRNGNLVLTNVP